MVCKQRALSVATVAGRRAQPEPALRLLAEEARSRPLATLDHWQRIEASSKRQRACASGSAFDAQAEGGSESGMSACASSAQTVAPPVSKDSRSHRSC